LLSHGHWHLKGLADLIELFEASDADTPVTPPTDAAKTYRVVRQGDLWLPVRGGLLTSLTTTQRRSSESARNRCSVARMASISAARLSRTVRSMGVEFSALSHEEARSWRNRCWVVTGQLALDLGAGPARGATRRD